MTFWERLVYAVRGLIYGFQTESELNLEQLVQIYSSAPDHIKNGDPKILSWVVKAVCQKLGVETTYLVELEALRASTMKQVAELGSRKAAIAKEAEDRIALYETLIEEAKSTRSRNTGDADREIENLEQKLSLAKDAVNTLG